MTRTLPTLSFLALGVAAWPVRAATLEEDFSSDPSERGWLVHGDEDLFVWDETLQVMRVTWDSSRPNSYLHLPLGTVLARDDDFELGFDLWLDAISAGTTPGKPNTFQIAIGLIQRKAAFAEDLMRGSGINSKHGARNSIEFDYFPDSDFGYGATVSPTLISSNNQFAAGFTFPMQIPSGGRVHVEMKYRATNQTLSTAITRDGVALGPVASVNLGPTFSDFRLDAFAVCNYSDALPVASPFAGSVLARGFIDDIVISFPRPPRVQLTLDVSDGNVEIGFESRENWVYTLERSRMGGGWISVGSATPGTGAKVTLVDTNPSTDAAMYRVRADRP